MTTERLERRDSQRESAYAVFSRLTGERLGMVRKLLDGTWSAVRGSGTHPVIVHGLKRRSDAIEALRTGHV